jgi:heme-degrading monooxygenase HmoA
VVGVYARSTTFPGRPDAVDAGIDFVRDVVMPALQSMPGFVGLSLLADRETGRCIATSAWQDLNAMRASNAGVQPLRERGAEIFGSRPQIEEWEIAALHREHPSAPGACARVVGVRTEPGTTDRVVERFRGTALPMLEELDGFCSASVLVDPSSGQAVVTSLYDSRQAIEASRERAKEIRAAASGEAGAEIVDVAEFELAVAHLKVPEMA